MSDSRSCFVNFILGTASSPERCDFMLSQQYNNNDLLSL